MISISIYDQSRNVEIDVMLQVEQTIADALKIMQEKGFVMTSDVMYVRLGNTNCLKNTKLTFQDAEIYTGEKVIIE